MIKSMEGKEKKVAALFMLLSFQILDFASSPSHLSTFMKITLYYFSCNKTKLQLIFVSYNLFGFLILKEY